MTDAEYARIDALEAELLAAKERAGWEHRARARLSRRNRAWIAFAFRIVLLALLAR